MLFMPLPLFALFAPRPVVEFKTKPKKRKCLPLSGIAAFTQSFEQEPPTKRVCLETPKERRERKQLQIREEMKEKLQEEIKQWNPHKIKNKHTEDALNTLFVGRLSYDVTERKLRREFEEYGPVKKITMINDEFGDPRGYAFVEYENEKDMKAAYTHADGKKIEGRRIVVDCERGRTVREWLPSRLGGGKGGRKDKPRKDGSLPSDSRSRPDERSASRSDRDRERDRGESRRY